MLERLLVVNGIIIVRVDRQTQFCAILRRKLLNGCEKKPQVSPSDYWKTHSLSPSTKWVPISHLGRIKQQKEKDGPFHLLC